MLARAGAATDFFAKAFFADDDSYLHTSTMPADPSRATHAAASTDGRRTAIAFVSATLISLALLAVLAIFDVR